MRFAPASLALLAAALSLAGCAFMESKKIDYKSAGTLPSLEVPPDLILPAGNSRFTLPEAARRDAATYSAFTQARTGQTTAQASGILPRVERARIERSGTQRWLVVDAPPTEVWPMLREFWQELGFIINIDMPEAGVIETDWAENRAKIPQDALRNLLGRVIDGLYSTAERDKFRTRIEAASDGRGTEIYISHRGMYEVFEGTQAGGDQGRGRTVWQPRPADPELEAEMLRRLMVRFGIESARAQALLAQAPAAPQATLIRSADGAPALILPETFERAWRRVGLALDRVGFVVEDRDRAGGVYYVRYSAPEADVAKSKGVLSRLAFWSRDDAPRKERYRVRVSGKGESSEVAIHLDSGAPAQDATGNRIASLLHEQLK